MKHITKSIFVLCLVFIASGQLSAQKAQKIGHIDFAKLYELIPGQDTIKVAFQKHQEQLGKTFQAMQTEYEAKMTDYQNNQATMSSIIKQTKEKEILDLQRRIQEYQVTAQEDLRLKEMQLTSPLIDKARKGVEAVAKENGYTYVLNTADGMVLYFENSDDLMPLVKKKLNLN